jgi:hypothetical protein
VDEADGPVVSDFLCTFLFRQKDDVGLVDQVKVMASQVIYRVYGIHYVVSHHLPTFTEEESSEAIWAWRLISWHLTNGLPNFVL